MSSCTPLTFSGVSPAQFARLQEKAAAAGIEINGPAGRASRMGIEVEWNYSEQTQELRLTCLHKPFFVKADEVNARLRSLVNETISA